MKGKRIYDLAIMIHSKMYHYPSTLSENKKKELYQKYLSLIRRSAHLGFTEAQYDLAQQYENMNFLALKNPLYNPYKCVYWYTKACLKGHAEACNNLGALYEIGDGYDKDFDKALELYKKSAYSGSPNGKKNLKILLRDLAKGGKYNR